MNKKLNIIDLIFLLKLKRELKAIWVNRDNDVPVTVNGVCGKSPTGRYYVSIRESDSGVPLDEIIFQSALFF